MPTDANSGASLSLEVVLPPAAVPEGRLDESGDARLVERARHGDDDAFAALVSRYETKLLRVLVRLVQDEEWARDLAQETFWRVYGRLDRFDTARRFGPWLFRVGLNLALDELRLRRGHVMASIDEPMPDGDGRFDIATPDPRIRDDLAQEVRYILEKIPSSLRTVLILRDLEGFSAAEIAAIIQKREATVRWRLAKARDLFREHWERREAQSQRRV